MHQLRAGAAHYNSIPADIPETELDRTCHLLGGPGDILWIDEVKSNATSISENGAYAGHSLRTPSNIHDCIKKQLSETQNRSITVTTMS
jgi:hypothetical protein